MVSMHKRLLTTALIVAFGSSFHSGFFMLVYNVPQDVLESFVNDSARNLWNRTITHEELTDTWSTVAGVNQIGRFVSCFVAPICADKLGRRNSLLLWSGPAAVGFLLQHLAYPSDWYPLLAAGRLLTGVYNGLVGIVVPLFLVEIAIVSQWRGAVTRVHNVVTVFGSIVALVLGLPSLLGAPGRWAWLPLVPMPLLLLQAFWLLRVPESPLHLVETGQSQEKVERSFRYYLSSDAEGEDQRLLRAYIEAGCLRRKASPAPAKWRLFTDRAGRRLVLLWVCLALAASLAGGSLTNNYSTAIVARFRQFSSVAKYSSIIINLFKFLSVLIALYSIDRLGRRVMLLYTGWMVMLCYVLLMVITVFTKSSDGFVMFLRIWFVLVWTCAQYIVNSTAVLITSESCQQHLRAFGMALFKIVYHTVCVVVTIVFPRWARVSEVWSYSLLAVPYLAVIFYLTIVCPETGNVNLLSAQDEQSDQSEKSIGDSAHDEQTPLINDQNFGNHHRNCQPFFASVSAGPSEIGPKR